MPPGQITQKQLSELIAANYAAAENSALWPDFLERISDALGATFSLMLLVDNENADGSVSEHCRSDPQKVREYQSYWRQQDVWLKRNAAAYQRSGQIVVSQSVAPNALVERTAFYQDFLRECDSYQCLTGTIYAEKDLFSLLSCHYSKRAGHRRPEEVQLLHLLMPHMQRSVSLHRRLRGPCETEEALRNALDQSPSGFLLLNSAGRVIWTNREAERILGAEDGLTLRHGLLSSDDDPQAENALAALGREALATTFDSSSAERIVTVQRRSGLDAYQLMASAVSLRGALFLRHRAAAVVMLRDPAREMKLPPHRLALLYGLTPQEARVAELLVNEMSPREVAERLRLSENTVRTHLKSIFHKANVRGQTELVRKLLLGLANQVTDG